MATPDENTMERLDSVDTLRRGDTVRPIGSGASYVVDSIGGVPGARTATAVRVITVTNADEWLVLRRKT